MAALNSFGRVALLLFVAGTAFATSSYACECKSKGGAVCSSLIEGGCTANTDGSCTCQ
jgi:hypothetical protein